MKAACLFLATLVFAGLAQGQESFLVRRVVVFPFDVPAGLKAVAEQAWWGARQELSDQGRFLIASRNFLVRKEVLQPRPSLSISDAVLLGKILDAHALITTQLEEKNLRMSAYSGQTGVLIWSQSLVLHPSQTTTSQLEAASKKLIRDFVSSIPYQGFQILDPLINRPVYDQGGKMLAKVDLGMKQTASLGLTVQWIRIQGIAPLFQGGGRVEVYAEGEVVQFENGIATVEIKRTSDAEALKESALVRVPALADTLNLQFALAGSGPRQNPEYFVTDLKATESDSAKTRPLLSTLATVATFAALLLLAL